LITLLKSCPIKGFSDLSTDGEEGPI